MEIPITRTEFRRRMAPGTQWILVENLQGPQHAPRTVVAHQEHTLLLGTPTGGQSTLHLEPGTTTLADGPTVLIRFDDGQLAAKYAPANIPASPDAS